VRLAVSNIAWEPADEREAIAIAAACGVEGIEIAPTRPWPDWKGASVRNAEAYRSRLEDLGMVCPALQAVMFGLPDLTLFGSERTRRRFCDHLRRVAALAHALGANTVVFGSPKNRDRGSLSSEQASTIAVATFRALAPDYAEASVTLCIEPNPPEYGCNFVTTVDEAVALADAVDTDGFGVHLDAGAIILSGGDGAAAVRSAGGRLGHFHISEPYLGSFEQPSPLHAALGEALDRAGYTGWRSIEMRAANGGLDHLEVAFAHARSAYFAAEGARS
jgi:D-psicose/D-tagatose/L-ribulose 3-epimerase